LSQKALPFKPERKHIIGHDGIAPVVLALAIGTVGGFIFNWLKMPLAWMLGSCLFAAFAGLRWTLLKNRAHLSGESRADLDALLAQATSKRTARAWRSTCSPRWR